MSLTVLVLTVLATYSITCLVIYDAVTQPARRWLQRVGHSRHQVSENDEVVSCECGTFFVTEAEPVDEAMDARYALSAMEKLDAHHATVASTGWRYLLSCPWCVSAWIGLLVVATALAWGDGWGWQLIAGTLAARAATGLLAASAHPPGDEERPPVAPAK